MAYAAQSDLVPRRLSQKELVELTDDAGSGEVDATVVTGILNEASAKIDSYAGGRYVLPLVVSEQLKGLTLDLAVHMLFARRRRIPQEVQDVYDRAISFLRDVSAGKAMLDQQGITQSVSGAAVKKDHTVDPDVFDNTRLEKF